MEKGDLDHNSGNNEDQTVFLKEKKELREYVLARQPLVKGPDPLLKIKIDRTTQTTNTPSFPGPH